ncbi:MAG TPA: histone deacetylase [Caldilineaceae bacterium]|nr:histone deacetylase [Caldilineaceae bacterium]
MPKTAIVYDPFNLKHTLEGHPENYRRLEGTWQLLQEDGILAELVRVPSSPAPLDAVLRVHTHQYVERLQLLSERGGGRIDADTYVNADSYQAALLAAGGLLNMTDMILSGQVDNGFALIRPPGHHALEGRGMGFCLLANAAIAARWAQDHRGVERVLIVDFDVHHGNGTQDIFYHDPSVLFFSTHQFPYYPGTGDADEMGSEIAYGTTVNVPLPPYVGDEGYLSSFQRVLEPVARGFQPELIILSAGFDAHWLDPLAGMNLSIGGYMKLVETVMALADELCQGKLVCILEGGYHLDVLAHCVLSTLHTLAGSPKGVSDPFGTAQQHERDVAILLQQLRRLHGIRDESFYSIP